MKPEVGIVAVAIALLPSTSFSQDLCVAIDADAQLDHLDRKSVV